MPAISLYLSQCEMEDKHGTHIDGLNDCSAEPASENFSTRST